jgi:hypothetical protein
MSPAGVLTQAAKISEDSHLLCNLLHDCLADFRAFADFE